MERFINPELSARLEEIKTKNEIEENKLLIKVEEIKAAFRKTESET